MRTLVILIIVGVAGWYGYGRYGQQLLGAHPGFGRIGIGDSASRPDASRAESPGRGFRCDGRIYCSQMTSCAEATFFLRNCPGVKMDGDNDGVPCERQWCG
jgi:hypothetical protein